MSKDLKQKKSDYLLELALEEQLEQDEDMKKYPLPEDVEHPRSAVRPPGSLLHGDDPASYLQSVLFFQGECGSVCTGIS